MPTLNYNTLKILRTNPKEFLEYRSSLTDSNLTAILVFNEELFQDMYFTTVEAPTEPAIEAAFKHYATAVNRRIREQGEIFQEQLDDLKFEIFNLGLDLETEKTDELFIKHEKYLLTLLGTNREAMSKEKIEELLKYKKIVVPHFPLHPKLKTQLEQKFRAKSFYINETKTVETYCLSEQEFVVAVPLGGNRKSLTLWSNIDFMLINHKEKSITIKAIEVFDEIPNFKKVFNERRLDLKIGINLLFISHTTSKEISKYTINYKIVGCDSRNCCVFTLSKRTIDKIKRSVLEDLENAMVNLTQGDYSLPGEYKKEYII